ncbi:hypothetical protein DFH09DRAFT_1312793 [Mycena vulgaris]|nr:hypothetical protein DFH09DRAFT_1312793 [Mycena vulgaris]
MRLVILAVVFQVLSASTAVKVIVPSSASQIGLLSPAITKGSPFMSIPSDQASLAPHPLPSLPVRSGASPPLPPTPYASSREPLLPNLESIAQLAQLTRARSSNVKCLCKDTSFQAQFTSCLHGKCHESEMEVALSEVLSQCAAGASTTLPSHYLCRSPTSALSVYYPPQIPSSPPSLFRPATAILNLPLPASRSVAASSTTNEIPPLSSIASTHSLGASLSSSTSPTNTHISLPSIASFPSIDTSRTAKHPPSSSSSIITSTPASFLSPVVTVTVTKGFQNYSVQISSVSIPNISPSAIAIAGTNNGINAHIYSRGMGMALAALIVGGLAIL